MVDAAGTNGKPAAAVKTVAALPQMDSAAQGRMFEEVQLLEMIGAIGAHGAGVVWSGGGGNPVGQADLNHQARLAALHEAQDAARDEPAGRPPGRGGAKTHNASQAR